jgi:hypothetical protein
MDVHEKLLKFKTDEFYIGEQQVARGSEFIAHPSALIKCWIKFQDNKFVERRVYRAAQGEKPPRREELGDLDEQKWPLGLDGKTPADPWVLQYLLPLEDTSGEIVVFATPSQGGRTGVANLVDVYGRRKKRNNGNCGQPIVKLARAPWPTRYGMKWRPAFEIVSWNESDGDVGEAPAPTLAQELNDEIPFDL